VEYGGNDCDFDWAAIAADPAAVHLPQTPLELYQQTLIDFIEQARSAGIEPLLLTLPPIDADKYFAWLSRELDQAAIMQWLQAVEMIYRHQELYSLNAMRIGYQQGCRVFDLRCCFLPQHGLSDLICLDGLHPTPAGYDLLWQHLSSELVDYLAEK
jgi:acyl-CoA thioesterase-1